MPEPAALLFVYGTLKRGDVRAPLLDGQRLIGEVATAPRYKLYNTGAYPALIDAPTGVAGMSILGELWAVDDKCLARLDLEEGVDEGLYQRRSIQLTEQHPQAEAYFYLLTIDSMGDLGACWDIG